MSQFGKSQVNRPHQDVIAVAYGGVCGEGKVGKIMNGLASDAFQPADKPKIHKKVGKSSRGWWLVEISRGKEGMMAFI